MYSAKATDDNVGENGVVDYYFLERDNLNHKTADFRINRVTGVIRAEVEFDREEKDTYFVSEQILLYFCDLKSSGLIKLRRKFLQRILIS